MPAQYPGAVAAFTTKNDGDVIAAAHINALQDEIAAIEASVLTGPFPLTGSLQTPLTVSGVRPTVLLDYTGQPIKGRLMGNAPGQTWVFHNVSYDGAIFNLDDISQPGLGFLLTPPNVAIYYFSAGANPRTATLQHVFQGVDGSIRERGRTTPMGEWTAVPFNAANFGASAGGTWTVTAGQVPVFHYTLVGKTLFVSVYVSASTVGGTAPNYLTITVPGFTFAASPQYSFVSGFVYETGVGGVQNVIRSQAPNSILIGKTHNFTGPAWALGAAQGVMFQMAIALA